MPIQTILHHVVPDRRCGAHLRMAASVCQRMDAELLGVGARPPWPYADVQAGHGPDFEKLVEAAREAIAKAQVRFETTMASIPSMRSSWRGEVGYPDQVLPRLSCMADLIVAYREGWQTDGATYAAPDHLVMTAGLPVLLMPAKETPFRPERVLLAWKNTAEARRAITAAMPILKLAKRILVAAVCQVRDVEDVEQETAEVVERLRRHGLEATSLVEVGAPSRAGRKLSRIASGDRSDLIVSGAYGHSRLREWILGGVTQDLIGDASHYVLLNH